MDEGGELYREFSGWRGGLYREFSGWSGVGNSTGSSVDGGGELYRKFSGWRGGGEYTGSSVDGKGDTDSHLPSVQEVVVGKDDLSIVSLGKTGVTILHTATQLR